MRWVYEATHSLSTSRSRLSSTWKQLEFSKGTLLDSGETGALSNTIEGEIINILWLYTAFTYLSKWEEMHPWVTRWFKKWSDWYFIARVLDGSLHLHHQSNPVYQCLCNQTGMYSSICHSYCDALVKYSQSIGTRWWSMRRCCEKIHFLFSYNLSFVTQKPNMQIPGATWVNDTLVSSSENNIETVTTVINHESVPEYRLPVVGLSTFSNVFHLILPDKQIKSLDNGVSCSYWWHIFKTWNKYDLVLYSTDYECWMHLNCGITTRPVSPSSYTYYTLLSGIIITLPVFFEYM